MRRCDAYGLARSDAAQDDTMPQFHCRGRFETDSEGRYSVRMSPSSLR